MPFEICTHQAALDGSPPVTRPSFDFRPGTWKMRFDRFRLVRAQVLLAFILLRQMLKASEANKCSKRWHLFAAPNGHFSDDCTTVLTAARLVAVGKPTGGIRSATRRTVLFAVALQRIILQLQDFFLRFQVWYLDDGHLCGTVDNVGRAMEQLKQSLPWSAVVTSVQTSKIEKKKAAPWVKRRRH